MKTITRYIYVVVAVVIVTMGAVATSADRGHRFASFNGAGAKCDGSIYGCAPNGVRSIIVSGPSRPEAVMVPISHTRTLSSVDYVVAGVCGVGGGSGTITIAGVSGTVTHAYLYWHGINNGGPGAEYNNPMVTINGNSVTGTSLGDATTNCWGAGSSRAFEADVTAFVAGNGPYTIAGLSDCLFCNANGASLVVVFDDGNAANNRDLVFFTGNDSNYPEGFPGEDQGWHATLPGIAYAGGMVKAIFHLADGQNFFDDSVTFSTGGPPLIIPDDATHWDGNSVPDAGTSRAPNGGLWDIHTFDITAAFGPPGSTTLQLDGQDNAGDCLGLVLMLLDLEPGSAPDPTPTPSPSPSASATATEPPPSPTATATATEPPPSPTPTPTATATAVCQFTTSITSNFNGTPIKSGNYIWFTSVLKPSGLGSTPVTFHFTGQTITSAFFTLTVPDADVTFDPAVTFATTTFSGGMWVTTVPSSGMAGNTFFSALEYQVPANLPGGINPVTWSGTISTNTPGAGLKWQWAAAVYTSFNTDYNLVGVKPVDDNKKNPYLNSDHAGTPENYKAFVTAGARGGGGSNYTGGLSGTASVGPCRP